MKKLTKYVLPIFLTLCLVAATLAQAGDCWLGSPCWISVSFPGWSCVPESCWCGPTDFSSTGAVATVVVESGALMDIQVTGSVSWTFHFSNGLLALWVEPNPGPPRSGTISFVGVDGTGLFRNCAMDVSQHGTPPPSSRPVLGFPVLQADGTLTITFPCQTNSTVVLEASSDLQNWSPVSTNSAPSGIATFSRLSAGSQGVRFFRAFIR